MKVDKYLLIALIYFFFNSFALPEGLTYTLLLTPLFYWWIRTQGGKQIEVKFLLFSVPFFLAHFLQGIVFAYYAKSVVLLAMIYIFAYAVHLYFKRNRGIEKVFTQILLINFAFTLVAIVLFFSPYREVLWTVRHLTREIQAFPRLQLLTYEPSYYSTLLVPIILYFLTKLLYKPYKLKTALVWLGLMFIPLILSFSLGVISTLVISLGIFFLIHNRHLLHNKRILVIMTTLVVIIVGTAVILLIVYPENPLYKRISNLFTGKDSSGQGRTTDALMLSYLIAKEKSLAFGAGLGQIKVLGETVIRNYYHYAGNDIRITRIPSALGETLGTFGFVGLILRFGLQYYLFFKTRVLDNYYRTMVFLYIFLYQLTGSFLTNPAEYVLWAIAFTPCCFYFDRKAIALNAQAESKTLDSA